MKINRLSEGLHLSRDTVAKAHKYYVIMQHFKTEDLQHTSTNVAVSQALNKTPKDELVIYDNKKISIEDDDIKRLYVDGGFSDNDLYIKLLSHYFRDKEFISGTIGIISYNETPLKALLGITVISTNSKIMGEKEHLV